MARIIILLFHFLGFGLFVTLIVAGIILERQYKKADLPAKVTILRAMRPIGLLSPVAVLIMLVTGIGNMHMLGYGILDLGWLTAKIIFFAIAVVSGAMFGVVMRKRGGLVMGMASGSAPANAQELLAGFDRQVIMFHVVMPILLLIILTLSIYGRLGGQ